MPIAICPGCQARYKVPDAAAGKKTACKKCGQTFRIPAPAPTPKPPPRPARPAPAEPELVFSDLDALARGEVVTAHHGPAPAGTDDAGIALAEAALVPQTVSYAMAPPGATTAKGAYTRYLAAIARSAVFLRKPGNLIVFVILWVLLAMREVMQTALSIAPCLILPFVGSGALLITGWYMAFKMNLVAWAAGEEEELPNLVADDGWWDGVVVPFFRLLTPYIFAFLPAGIYFILLSHRVGAAVAASAAGLAPGLNPLPGPSALIVLVLLSLLGLFAWPMMVLIVSCGGSVGALFRLDLLGATVLKSLPAYLLTVIAVYLTFAVQLGISMLIWNNVDQSKNWWDDWAVIFVVPMLLVGVSLYFDVVAMRAIGYYYACFKHKFAWSWG
jgi:predicted Zn finger-like uncharacterized protein